MSKFKVGDKVLYKGKKGYTIHHIVTNTNLCWLIQPIIRGMLQATLTDLTLDNETT